MSDTNQAAAGAEAKKEKGESPILRGLEKGQPVLSIWGHKNDKGEVEGGHGYVKNEDGSETRFNVFFNQTKGTPEKPSRPIVVLSAKGPKGADGKDTYQTIGFGNAVNSDSREGATVYFDTVVFNIGNRSIGARVTNAAADFHEKLGFTSPRVARPKAEATAQAAGEGEGEAGEGEQAARPRQRG